MKIRLIKYVSYERVLKEKKCALCLVEIPDESKVNICNECLKCADCCVGLEKL